MLQQFSTFEQEAIQEAVEKVADAVEMWLHEDMNKVMQEFNKKPKVEKKDGTEE